MDPVERRIDAALAALPGPSREVTDRARERAIAAARASGRPTRRALGLSTAGAAAALIVGAVVAIGLMRHRAPEAPVAEGSIDLPSALDGVAVRIGDTAWVRTRTGFDIRGRRADAVDLSPNSRFVAVGRGRRLTALAPDGTTAWTREASGPIVAVAWAPNPVPIFVAYVARDGVRMDLRLVEGDGDHDRLVTRNVTAHRPAWNRQPLQVWFERPDGTAWIADPASARVIGQTKPAFPDATSEAVTARAATASGHPNWVGRAAARTAAGSVAAIAPPPGDGPGVDRPIEIWWVPTAPTDPPRLMLRVSGSTAATVEISARP